MGERSRSSSSRIPVLLLKTKSTPLDAYEQYFSADTHRWGFEPAFVPVLEHRFEESGLAGVKTLLDGRLISGGDGEYGGLIFTSQRAVEASAKIIEEGRGTSHAGMPYVFNLGIDSPQTRFLIRRMDGLISSPFRYTPLAPPHPVR
jgi:uroporphyrinogen-III synthase